MRTTIDLPDELFRALKLLAAKRGASLNEVLRSAVESELKREAARKRRERIPFPVLDSHEPGALTLTNGEIEEHYSVCPVE